jgi:hypothetical protein
LNALWTLAAILSNNCKPREITTSLMPRRAALFAFCFQRGIGLAF